MKKTHTVRTFVAGFLAAMLLGAMLPSAVAAVTGKNIMVYPGINIFIDDQKLDPTDVNGDPVEVFNYNGTVYLPIRAVSEALRLPVQWDGATRSVYVGRHTSDTPVAYLSQLDYFSRNGTWVIDNVTKDNLGVDHTHTIKLRRNLDFSGDITYKLNGQYSRLTASFFLNYDYRSTQTSATMVIYGDGRELWRGTVDHNTDPIDIDIDITGVLELKLEQPSGAGTGCAGALGDAALWT